METATAVPVPQQSIARFAAIVGTDHCISEPDQLLTYECDALTSFHARPGLVVLPGSTAEVVEVVKLARELAMPIVPRGSGTGLSGGALVGSEGTLCIVTEVVLRILRKPEATRTFFATFPSTTEAGHAVSYIISAGIVPAAIEMMDRLAIVAIKAATGVDWPDVGAALLIDVDGPAAEVEHTAAAATELAQKAGALEIR